MKNKTLWIVISGLIFASGNVFNAYADDPQAEVAARKEAYRKVIIACKNVNDSRESVHACVKLFHENVQACIAKQGVKPPVRGQKPSDADIAVMKKCHEDQMSSISGSKPAGK